MNAAQLNAIKERMEETPFNKAYVKGDPWKGYEVRSEGNGQTLAETSSGTDAEFIAHAYEDIPALVAEVERLQNRCELYEVARRNDGKMIEYKDAEIARLRAELTDIIAVATEEASSISHDNGYVDIIAIARSALK